MKEVGRLQAPSRHGRLQGSSHLEQHLDDAFMPFLCCKMQRSPPVLALRGVWNAGMRVRMWCEPRTGPVTDGCPRLCACNSNC